AAAVNSAAGNSRSRRSAAPTVRIRGRELAGRSAFSFIFFTTKHIISQKSAKFHFFSENCSGILLIFPPQGQKSSPSGSFSAIIDTKSASESQIDPPPPLMNPIQTQPKLKRRRQFLKNCPSFTFFQKTPISL
ncbi:MAG: hypothetical protein IKI42_10190, partial [Clostridia bacterium]|nr:hypothetical protein [Clostridia bacterium]